MGRFVASAAVEDASFRGRCESALTHPITLASLGLLLLNDLALKSFWHGAWATGKLSDFAWMVFAPPLLAYLLSFATRGQPGVERTAFAVAYAGLPLLYAAFNTFPALHDAVMAALLPLTGSSAGSPLDPTDSVVIPFAAAVALWVWHRPPKGVPTRKHRTSLGLLAAVIASLATVATSPIPVTGTEWLVGIDGRGAAVVDMATHGGLYTSPDGGLTWEKTVPAVPPISWGKRQAETPRGVYALEGHAVVRTREGGAAAQVYSAPDPQTEPERWTLRYETGRRRDEAVSINQPPLEIRGTEPVNIVHHRGTGNVIVSMGLEGVLVGDGAENWQRVAVGEFAPTDYSTAGRIRTLFAGRFWTAAVCIALLFTLAPAAAVRRRGESTRRAVAVVALAALGALAAVLNFVVGPGGDLITMLQVLWMTAGVASTLTAAAIRLPYLREVPVMVLTATLITGVLALLALLWISERVNLFLVIPVGLVLLCLMAYLLYRYLNERGSEPRNPAEDPG